MPSISIQPAFVVIATATALGVITLSSTDGALIFPGAYAWLQKDDTSVPSVRVKILTSVTASTTTTLTVKVVPNDADTYGDGMASIGSHVTNNPSYTTASVAAFNTTSHLCQDGQSVPIDPAYSLRRLPA